MSRLRRFLPPQVADLIVASGTEKQLETGCLSVWDLQRAKRMTTASP